jgi:hypothetical protein
MDMTLYRIQLTTRRVNEQCQKYPSGTNPKTTGVLKRSICYQCRKIIANCQFQIVAGLQMSYASEPIPRTPNIAALETLTNLVILTAADSVRNRRRRRRRLLPQPDYLDRV